MNDQADNVDNGEDEEIILADLSDEELIEQMHDDLYDGMREEIVEGTQIFLDRGWSAEKTLNEALVEGHLPWLGAGCFDHLRGDAVFERPASEGVFPQMLLRG